MGVRTSYTPASAEDAERWWGWARQACLPHFGPFEDAMSRHSRGLFHTRLSPLMNLHRLLPARVVEEVAADAQLPLSCREGFVRQILGWREYVHHLHEQTRGLRELPEQNFFGAQAPLAPTYWGQRSGLGCLDQVVEGVWAEGYSHHITRLMVLCNLATLLELSPREVTDWFWAAYLDAYDWVVEPNVLGMGTFALGDVMMTKPYICGSAYIDRMSNFCAGCAFHPKRTCPITPMYWAHLDRHARRLAGNRRMAVPLMGLKRRDPARRARDRKIAAWAARGLAEGSVLRPEDLPED